MPPRRGWGIGVARVATKISLLTELRPISGERRHFCRLPLHVRPMAIASPTLFICVVSVGSACRMVAVRKHLEGEARNLGDDVINARLEACRGFARDVVLEFVEP